MSVFPCISDRQRVSRSAWQQGHFAKQQHKFPITKRIRFPIKKESKHDSLLDHFSRKRSDTPVSKLVPVHPPDQVSNTKRVQKLYNVAGMLSMLRLQSHPEKNWKPDLNQILTVYLGPCSRSVASKMQAQIPPIVAPLLPAPLTTYM